MSGRIAKRQRRIHQALQKFGVVRKEDLEKEVKQ